MKKSDEAIALAERIHCGKEDGLGLDWFFEIQDKFGYLQFIGSGKTAKKKLKILLLCLYATILKDEGK